MDQLDTCYQALDESLQLNRRCLDIAEYWKGELEICEGTRTAKPAGYEIECSFDLCACAPGRPDFGKSICDEIGLTEFYVQELYRTQRQKCIGDENCQNCFIQLIDAGVTIQEAVNFCYTNAYSK